MKMVTLSKNMGSLNLKYLSKWEKQGTEIWLALIKIMTLDKYLQ